MAMNSSTVTASTERTVQAQEEKPQDCLSCRIIGTGTLGGVGTYALWQSRAAAPGTPLQKKCLAVVGLGLVVGGVLRWNKCTQIFPGLAFFFDLTDV